MLGGKSTSVIPVMSRQGCSILGIKNPSHVRVRFSILWIFAPLALTSCLAATTYDWRVFNNSSYGTTLPTLCTKGLRSQIKVNDRTFESPNIEAGKGQLWGPGGDTYFPGLDMSVFTPGSTITVTAFCQTDTTVGQSRITVIKKTGASVLISIYAPEANAVPREYVIDAPGPIINISAN